MKIWGRSMGQNVLVSVLSVYFLGNLKFGCSLSPNYAEGMGFVEFYLCILFQKKIWEILICMAAIALAT